MTMPVAPRRRGLEPALVFAAVIAAIGWFALSTEFVTSVSGSLHKGRGIPESLYLFFRFFTILTNIGIATLMSVTAWRLAHRIPLPPASFYAAGLDYIIIVGATYELMLRRLWSPVGLQFYTDMMMHDIIPVLMFAFWLVFAPKAPLSSPLRWLAYPVVYFALTLAAGAFGQGYPYGFLNPDKLGYAGVLRNAVVFLALFYALGLGLTWLARSLPAPRS